MGKLDQLLGVAAEGADAAALARESAGRREVARRPRPSGTRESWVIAPEKLRPGQWVRLARPEHTRRRQYRIVEVDESGLGIVELWSQRGTCVHGKTYRIDFHQLAESAKPAIELLADRAPDPGESMS